MVRRLISTERICMSMILLESAYKISPGGSSGGPSE